MNQKKLFTCAISVLMLILVLTLVDFGTLQRKLADISLSTIVLVVVGYLVGQVLSAFKWWLIARESGIVVPFSRALKSYFIGMYVNCFGFGVVGGDVTRGILIAQGKYDKTPAVASVLADRAQGLAVLALIGVVSTAAFQQQTLDPIIIAGLWALSAILVVGWFIGPSLLLKIVPDDNRFRRKVEQIAAAFPKSPGIILSITILSVAFHMLQIGLHYAIFVDIDIHIPWSVLLIYIPLVNILSSLPISWNGLGVRENSYAFFLSAYGVSPGAAVAIGAIWLAAVISTSAIGGALSVLARDSETAVEGSI